jgi:hypothetical protein
MRGGYKKNLGILLAQRLSIGELVVNGMLGLVLADEAKVHLIK